MLQKNLIDIFLFQYGSDALEDLKNKVSDFERTAADSEAMLMETQKALATANDEKLLLEQEMVFIYKYINQEIFNNDINLPYYETPSICILSGTAI